jgi:hypothetical protein
LEIIIKPDKLSALMLICIKCITITVPAKEKGMPNETKTDTFLPKNIYKLIKTNIKPVIKFELRALILFSK